MANSHSHDGVHTHSHDHAAAAPDHGHTHEILDGPGSYMGREMPIIEGRDWSERAFTVGIGGYVAISSVNQTRVLHDSYNLLFPVLYSVLAYHCSFRTTMLHGTEEVLSLVLRILD